MKTKGRDEERGRSQRAAAQTPVSRTIDAALHLAAIVQSSDDAIISKDLNGVVTSWNAAAEAIFGYSAEEMIGQPITRIFPPDRLQEEDCILARTKTGPGVRRLETVRVRKDGQPVNVSLTVSPIRDSGGRVIGASKIVRDISERLQAAKSLRESEERLRRVTEHLREGLIISDPDGNLLYWNAAALRLHGFESVEECLRGYTTFVDTFVLKRANGEVMPPDEWPIARIVAGEDLRGFEVRVQNTRAGWERVFSYRGTLVRGTETRPLAFVTVTDITERRAAEEQIRELNTTLERRVAERTAELEAANKELEAFSYSISHDLRAPLRAVDGFSQAVLEDYAHYLPEDGRRCLQTVRDSAQRMGALIDDLLAFSRLGRLPRTDESIDMEGLVNDVLNELRFEREKRHFQIRLGNLGRCVGDPALLKQVWMNLVSNAQKYTRRREIAEIEIGSFERDAETIWFLRDNGAGFDMRYVDKLFGVFQRLHRAEDYEGTGVGLAIVQRIVQRHGGRIWAEAEVERGATFFFTLGGRQSE